MIKKIFEVTLLILIFVFVLSGCKEIAHERTLRNERPLEVMTVYQSMNHIAIIYYDQLLDICWSANGSKHGFLTPVHPDTCAQLREKYTIIKDK